MTTAKPGGEPVTMTHDRHADDPTATVEPGSCWLGPGEQFDSDFVSDELVASLTEDSRRPPSVNELLRRAYGDRSPGSGQRWLDQEAEREWFARPAPVAKGGRTCQTCGQSYGSRRHHGVRFCSMDCYLAAVRPDHPAPTHQEVVLEMIGAYNAAARALAC
jgi:hypothetical protein